ncbi:hypothetical protein PRZ48_010113 [Zasmidium cellare]|uniref:Hydrophobin n=1 Tax=Zasmidium cellare TaxID=395010 RepID=A0ABR0EDN0_ZASCE|nr:hypothetical protein PRZ48_010113 [Zasmidium cellare]
MLSLTSNAPLRLLLAGSVATVGAVTITLSNYGNGPLCTGPVILSCPNIAPQDCCSANVSFDETLFQGLPPTGIGIVYGGFNCTGNATNSGYGDAVQSNSTKRDEKECNPVLPTTLGIGNRTFEIFGDVPPEVSQDMLDFFEMSRGIAAVPEVPSHFVPHELV